MAVQFPSNPLNRRTFHARILAAAGAALTEPHRAVLAAASPAVLRRDLPTVTHGVASGDVTHQSAVIWGRADRTSRMMVEWSTSEKFQNVRRITGPVTDTDADFTAKTILTGLPAGQKIHYRVRFEDRFGKAGAEELGSFATPSLSPQEEVFFAWSGDTCGQGYGIDESRGGLLTYKSILAQQPQFFLHSGDNIYADGPIAAELRVADGTIWKNIVTESKSKVAQTLDDFRGNFQYNLLDRHVRALQAQVPIVTQWDDHEVLNNWYPGQDLKGTSLASKYQEQKLNILAARGKQAFLEYTPVTPHAGQQIYRRISRGPLCELFVLDFRTYRGPNTSGRQLSESQETVFLGSEQLQWLKAALVSSTATWKVICADMPLALVIGAFGAYDGPANGDAGTPKGRELELAQLLSHLKRNGVRNVIWLTADVHYCASHHFQPSRATFTDFDPFWEFVSGPLHAGTFGPNTLDSTFGPEVKYSSRAVGSLSSGPWTKEQFFGTVRIDARSRSATVTHYNRDGEKLWSLELPPEA